MQKSLTPFFSKMTSNGHIETLDSRRYLFVYTIDYVSKIMIIKDNDYKHIFTKISPLNAPTICIAID